MIQSEEKNNQSNQPRIIQVIKLVDKNIKKVITTFHIFKNLEKTLNR